MKQKYIAPRTGVTRVVLALALAGSCAVAQAAAEEETELAPVTVSAHEGQAVPYDRTGVSVTVLDVPQLKKEGVYGVSDALTTVPGMFVLPGGGLNQRGNYTNVSVRGMSSGSYTMPMVDGMRLSSTSGSGNTTPNVLARANLFDLGNVEVLRGAEGATYGGGAMGGVIYMETPEGKGEPSVSLFSEGGSFDSYTGNMTAQGKVGKDAFFVSATYDHTNNNVRYADGGRPGVRHAGRYTDWSEAVRLDHDINESAKATVTYRREDADFRYAPQGSYSDYLYRSNLLTGKVQWAVNPRFSSSLMAGYYGTDYKLGEGAYYDLRNVQVEWRNAYKWNDRNTTTFGLGWTRSLYSVDNAYETSVRNSSRNLDNTYGIFAEHSVQPVKNWDNSLALRLDQSSNFDALFTLRAASSYKFNGDRTRVFASAGRGYLAPNSFQHSAHTYQAAGYYWDGYYYPGTIYKGNPNVDCEKNWTADLGVEHQFLANQFVSATLFWSRVTDGIDTVSAPDYSYMTFRNDSSHWTTQGAELALYGTIEKAWNTGYKLSCTLTQPKDTQDKQLGNTARRTWSADVHTSPIEGLTTGIGLTAVSGRSDYAKGSHLDNYCVLRWYANYEVNEHLTLHLRVENVTDEKFEAESNYYAPQGSFLNAGTGIFGGATVKF